MCSFEGRGINNGVKLKQNANKFQVFTYDFN